jgi:hypothetical protein
MSEKRLTVILYGCDRSTWRGGPLDLRISDIFASGGPRLLYEGRSEEATIELRLQLPFDAGQLYGFTFSAPDHRPAWQLVRRRDFIRTVEDVEVDDVILRLMLLPDAPGTTDLPKAFDRLQQIGSPFAVPGTGIGAGAFQDLADPAKMAFLNIEAKLRETSIDGSPLMSFVRGVTHVAVDRVFVLFDPGLKARMPRATEFADAPGHAAPKRLPDLPDHPDSWKHVRFAEGNIQLSFSKDAAPAPGVSSVVHSADVDIDLGRGLAHAKEWLENNVFRPGHKTNQALVYGQLYAQGILPRYVLDPAPATTQRAVPTLILKRVSSKQRASSVRRSPTRRAAPRRPRRRSVARGSRKKSVS